MSRIAIRDLATVLLVSWLARGAFITAIGDAHSLDVEFWEAALAAQDEGRNPYETGVLNWPPLWLMVIVALDYGANVLGVGFLTALRVYLVLVESALVVALYFTVLSSGGERSAIRRALLVGIALNPIAILLVCQHGNSDVQIGLLVVLAVAALGAYSRSRDGLLWLSGCLFVGLGILAKTVPFVLAPLLASGARLASGLGRSLGAVLLLGPAALGMGVILALAPSAVLDHVIGYRSTPGAFGVAGMVREFAAVDERLAVVTLIAAAMLAALLLLWRRWSSEWRSRPDRSFLLLAAAAVVGLLWIAEAFDRLSDVDVRGYYTRAFTFAMLAALAWLAYRLWRSPPLAPRALFLLSAVVFMLVVAFGPGYGPQYAYWFLPALVATYVLFDDAWRRLLLAAYLVAALTYGLEYAVLQFLGAYAAAIFGTSAWMTDYSDYRAVLLRLPLLVAYLLLIAQGIRRLARELETQPA